MNIGKVNIILIMMNLRNNIFLKYVEKCVCLIFFEFVLEFCVLNIFNVFLCICVDDFCCDKYLYFWCNVCLIFEILELLV